MINVFAATFTHFLRNWDSRESWKRDKDRRLSQKQTKKKNPYIDALRVFQWRDVRKKRSVRKSSAARPGSPLIPSGRCGKAPIHTYVSDPSVEVCALPLGPGPVCWQWVCAEVSVAPLSRRCCRFWNALMSWHRAGRSGAAVWSLALIKTTRQAPESPCLYPAA